MEKSTYIFMKYVAWKAYCARHDIAPASFGEFRAAYLSSMHFRTAFVPHFMMAAEQIALASRPFTDALRGLAKAVVEVKL